MKYPPILSVAFAALVLSQTASAHPSAFKGDCAKEAVNAAVTKWADVPNPSASLEYIPVSAEPKSRGSDTYVVVLAFSDGNETAYGKYEVTFGELRFCRKPVVKAAN